MNYIRLFPTTFSENNANIACANSPCAGRPHNVVPGSGYQDVGTRCQPDFDPIAEIIAETWFVAVLPTQKLLQKPGL